MDWNPDFRDLFCALNGARVKYLIVGGYAVIFHAEPRYTKDIDVLIEPTRRNAQRALVALASFGAPVDSLTCDDLMDSEIVYQIGVAPNRIDIMSHIKGVVFASAWPKRVRSRYGDQPIAILDRDSLRRAKRAAGRTQDLLDLQALGTPSSRSRPRRRRA